MEQEPELGPAMQALPNDRWREFVNATFEMPTGSHSDWARYAGYYDNGKRGIKVTGYRLWHDRRIQAAILEEAQHRIRGLAPFAIDVIHKVASNPQASGAERINAAKILLNRGGLHGIQEQKQTVTLITDDREKLAKLQNLERKLGLTAGTLVGRSHLKLARPAIDAEFVENVDLEDFI